MSLQLLACQINIPEMTTPDHRNAHLDYSAHKVTTALQDQPANLVVLPELSSIDYSRATFNHLDVLSEPLDGPSFKCWQRVAQENSCHIVYSFPRINQGVYYITVAVVNPQGDLVGHYDKMHLAQYGASMEKDYFSRGDHLFTFDLGGLTFAPIICYDIRIPELSRALVLNHGVDVILHCGAYFRDPSFATWHDFTTTRALENQVFLLSLNRAGRDYGNSRFCLPWMDEAHTPITFADHAEQFMHITIEPSEIVQARETYSFLKDRLPVY